MGAVAKLNLIVVRKLVKKGRKKEIDLHLVLHLKILQKKRKCKKLKKKRNKNEGVKKKKRERTKKMKERLKKSQKLPIFPPNRRTYLPACLVLQYGKVKLKEMKKLKRIK